MNIVEQLEAENKRLKEQLNNLREIRAGQRGILNLLTNKNKLGFIYPHWDMKEQEFTVSSTISSEYNKLRDIAVSVVDIPIWENKDSRKNIRFYKQNVKSMSDYDLRLAANCCEELIEVLYKHKLMFFEAEKEKDPQAKLCS